MCISPELALLQTGNFLDRSARVLFPLTNALHMFSCKQGSESFRKCHIMWHLFLQRTAESDSSKTIAVYYSMLSFRSTGTEAGHDDIPSLLAQMKAPCEWKKMPGQSYSNLNKMSVGFAFHIFRPLALPQRRIRSRCLAVFFHGCFQRAQA